MEKTLDELKDIIYARRDKWETAKDNKFPTSIFVCNRRIHRLNEALKMIEELELTEKFTRIGQ